MRSSTGTRAAVLTQVRHRAWGALGGRASVLDVALQYFGARYYDTVSGRFTSVDPASGGRGALAEPQRWNRYADAGNNPLRFNDPNGEDFWDFVNGAGNSLKADIALAIGRSNSGNSGVKIGRRMGD